ncbi:MAG: glycoside hydrolase family 125 protein [Cyclobacteriaceae bacterium]|nr:glycoside hydrolase family 125 protein [Cyclobacteriaceae bacterium]
MDRRSFIINSGMASAAIAAWPLGTVACTAQSFQSRRPPLEKRTFQSTAVEKTIMEVKKGISNPELAWMFENCYPNTLDTTVDFGELNGKPDTFIITGDIDAMWLRDSTAQVWPYLPLVNGDADLRELFRGLINRQAYCIRIDPFANAFNKEATGSYWETDLTDMKPELHERKWEIDSLCYAIRLAYHYWKQTTDVVCFDESWKESARLILSTFRDQQRKEGRGSYRFNRNTPVATDTLPVNGYGNPVNPVGLICSSFRPSDDATIFPFLIPSNLFAVVSLRQMAEMLEKIYMDTDFSKDCLALADEVEKAIYEYAVIDHLDFGKILAYEVDGFGNRLFMDDANVPSLLSMPYLGCIEKNDPLYQRTRRFLLSRNNPWYFEGKAGKGIGGPHVGLDMIWPMSIIMQAFTSEDDQEITECIRMLIATHAGTGFMHETFHKDDPANFTREWFAWANTLFGELIISLHQQKPSILRKI